ncbi:MAG TPA: DUF4097 family beta strand repeat-containing protein [Gemmatimonadaceae bacterium]
MRSSLIGAFLLAVTALPAQAQRRRDDGRTYDREPKANLDTTVAIQPGGVVALTTREGDIVVHTGTGNRVTVHSASGYGRIRFDASDNRVSVDASDVNGDARLEITVPVGTRISAQSREGTVNIQGTKGAVSVRTQNGDVKVQDAAGHIDFGTLSGDITASELNGDVNASSVSGDVVLSSVTGNVSATTVSGNVRLENVTSHSITAQSTSSDVSFQGIIAPDGRYEFTTHSGDVELAIPPAASAQLTVSTWNGSIDSDFPITLQPGEHGVGIDTGKRFTFNVGGGAARISAETFSGDVIIRRRGPK